MNYKVNELLEYDSDKRTTARRPEIDSHLTPQIRLSVWFPGDCEEIGCDDSKIEPVYYKNRQAN